MALLKKSITVTDHQKRWIKACFAVVITAMTANTNVM